MEARRQRLIRGMARSILESGAIIMPPDVAAECDALGLSVNGELTEATERAIQELGVALPTPLPEADHKPFFEATTEVRPEAFSNDIGRCMSLKAMLRAYADLRDGSLP